uniref:keratinocyte proline-rich protein-like n=1 Tax=Podarcis muralis TaxID=64176 RepID=UPI00109F5DC8|nr:keratinocyte proline-rich protein-like [Podarcis muralis]
MVRLWCVREELQRATPAPQPRPPARPLRPGETARPRPAPGPPPAAQRQPQPRPPGLRESERASEAPQPAEAGGETVASSARDPSRLSSEVSPVVFNGAYSQRRD